MKKKIFTFLLFLFLSSCGYEAIYSVKNSNNYNFSISKLTIVGQRDVNLKIKEKLNNYILAGTDQNLIIKISSIVEKVVLAKDTSGDPTSFKSTVIVNVEVLNKDNLQIIENFTYNNIENKFDLKRYEREIIINLAETATNKLIYKLSNIK